MSHRKRQLLRAARRTGRQQAMQTVRVTPAAPAAKEDTTIMGRVRAYLKARKALRWVVMLALIAALTLWLLGIEEMAHCALCLAIESLITHLGLRLIGFE